MKTRIGILLSALTGLLIAISAIYDGIFAWVAFVPVIIALNDCDVRRGLIYGAVGGICAGVWLFYGVLWYGLQYYIVLIVYNALQGVLSAGFYVILKSRLRNPFLKILILPLVWISFEYLKTFSPISFPAPLGATQYRFKSLIQLASITGVYGVSLLVLWMNHLIAIWAIELYRFTNSKIKDFKNLKYVFLASMVILLIFITTIVWGHDLLKKNPPVESRIKISILQGNVPIEFYWKQRDSQDIKDSISKRYFEMTDRALRDEGPDILVWPEGAIYEKVMEMDDYKRRLTDYAKRFGSFIIVGAPGVDEEGYNTNSAYVISNNGEVIGRYDKVRIVPFLEGYKKGRGYLPIHTDLGKFGIAICFESIYPQVTRELVKHGSEILFILTNDCGFGSSPLASMHAKDSCFRAVETRRYVVRADQSGISLIIDPFGRILKQYEGSKTKIISGYVNIKKDKTIYTMSGDLLPFMSFILGAIIMLKKRQFK